MRNNGKTVVNQIVNFSIHLWYNKTRKRCKKMNRNEYYILNNGIKIPKIGFGTWQAKDGEEAYSSCLNALKAGYRHIDTAFIYGNEESVGKAIKDSKIPRNQLFITTKLWNDVRGYEETKKAIEKSLESLGLDYIDLYLIHWPNPVKYRQNYIKMNQEAWRAMEEMYHLGKIKAIGVSNFLVHHLDELLETAKVIPAVNQIKLYPGLNQEEVVDYCMKKNILLEAYSPFGTGKIFEVQKLQEMAIKYNKSVAQICIRYSLQKGFLPLPKSVTPSRIIDNLNVFDFILSDEDMEILNTLPNYVGPLKDIDNINY